MNQQNNGNTIESHNVRFTFRQTNHKNSARRIVLMLNDDEYDTNMDTANAKEAAQIALLFSGCFSDYESDNTRPDLIPLVFDVNTEVTDSRDRHNLIIHTTGGEIETTCSLYATPEHARLFKDHLNEQSLLSETEQKSIINLSLIATENSLRSNEDKITRLPTRNH